MADKLIIVGSGGCMRELLWQINNNSWNIIGYVDKMENSNITELPYLGNDEYLLNINESINVAVCIGDAVIRHHVINKLKGNEKLLFPPIIAENVAITNSSKISEGTLIGFGCVISANVTIGRFAFINTNALISHDCLIGDYTTISPSVSLAGNVSVGSFCEIGIGANAIQGVSIGNKCIIGAGAVVIHDIPDNSTAVGVPAKKIK